MITFAWIMLFIIAMVTLWYNRASLIVQTIAIAVLLVLVSVISAVGIVSLTVLWLVFLAILVPLNFLPLRRQLISKRVLTIYRKMMPSMSETEKEALTAGSVGWTAELFSGMPDWNKLKEIPAAKMSVEEQDFVDNIVDKLCKMIDNWTISRTMKVPDDIWDFIRKEGFFGMIIPKQYGGKEFSATAHAQVIMKVSGVSISVASIIGVPNSLGPGELLLHYGTEEQKNYYLPRLARGEEIPCFALTSPVAGSDASSITDHGVVCKHKFEGKEQVCIRLNWDKRYITLAPVATILGLAFKLYDPEHLLGDKDALGITVALIPTNLPGVVTGRRHYPLDAAFPNGPTQGKDVIIPVDYIIGGVKMVGAGWRMLMECLAAGRSISLPSMVAGGVKRAALASGAYARIRRQFNTYIGSFGGVEEALTRIGCYSYAIDACRLFTVAMLDQRQKPAVASAISKYHTTEMSCRVNKDAMDIHGGKAICMGPNNYLAQGYIEHPIGITVEGANILTRSMIIFGQGAIRCHPYVLPEMTAAQDHDARHGLIKFDRAIFSHLGFFISNIFRSLLLGLSNGYIASAPSGPLKRFYQQFTRFSAILALVADFCMMTMGGALKRNEKLSGRLGDLLSLIYIGTAVIKYYETGFQGQANRKEELTVVQWVCQDTLYKLQARLSHLLDNLPKRSVAWILRILTLPLGKIVKPPKDHLGAEVAKLLLKPSVLRDRFAVDVYLKPHKNNPIGHMEDILEQVIAVEPIEKKISQAMRDQLIKGKNLMELVKAAVTENIIVKTEADQLLAVDKARMQIINVDDFADEEFVDNK